MRKIIIPVILVLVLSFAGNLSADPVKTFENFWSSIFEDGDLKHAFSLLAQEDQDFVKMMAPDAYSYIMGDVKQELGEFGNIAASLQKIVLSTIGKLHKMEASAGEKVEGGQEVMYSVILPTDIDFILDIAKWAETKGEEFDANEDKDMATMIKETIEELNTKLQGISYKTSISINSFAVIINQEGQERIKLDLMGMMAKMQKLQEMD